MLDFKMKKIILALFSCLCFSSANATLVTIDFDDLSSGITVGSNYSGLGVTFVDAVTSSNGSLPGGTTPTSIMHSSSAYGPQPSNPIEAIFNSLVSSVSLTGLDVGGDGFILSAYDAISGGNLLTASQIFGSGYGIGQFFTLNVSAAGIQRVEFSQLTNTHGDGIAFENQGVSQLEMKNGLEI